MSTITELCATPPPDLSPELKYSQLLSTLITLTGRSVPPAETQTLLSWLPGVMLPTAALLPPEHILEDDDDVAPPAAVLEPYQLMCRLALQLIERLAPADISPELAVALIAQTSPHDPWTTAQGQTLSAALLATHTLPASTPAAILTALKPHFTTPHAALTPRAHAATRPSTARAPLIPATAPPYRSTHPHIPTLLHWTTLHLPHHTPLEPLWPLIIPPLLTLLDDPHAPTRAHGARVLSALLNHPATPAMLARTGLGPVLWDAALPCVFSLPPLTPTALAVPLLQAAYPALVALARTLGGGRGRERARLLGVLLRRGVLAGMQYAGEYAAVAEVLVRQVGVLVGEMGVWCVRHLGECVGVLVAVLVDPFVGVRWGLAVAALAALVEVVRVGWVRVVEGGWVWGVVRACVVCWRRVVEDEGRVEGGGEVMGGLRRCVGVLAAVVGREEWEGVVREVVEVDKSAVGLFEGTVGGE